MFRNSRGSTSSPSVSHGKAQNGTAPRSTLLTPTRSTVRRNTSILNFFKTAPPPKLTQNRITDYAVRASDGTEAGLGRNFRTDVTDSSESLFFEDEAGDTGAGPNSNQFVDQFPESVNASPKSPHGFRQSPRHDSLRVGEDEERYNENGKAAIKRRKLDNIWAEGEPGSPLSHQVPHSEGGLGQIAVPTSLTEGSKIQRNGPFIDESDSEDAVTFFIESCPSVAWQDAELVIPVNGGSTAGKSLEEAVPDLPDALDPSPLGKEMTDLVAEGRALGLRSEHLMVEEEELCYQETVGVDLEVEDSEGPSNFTIANDDDNLDVACEFSDGETAVCPVCRAGLGKVTDHVSRTEPAL